MFKITFITSNHDNSYTFKKIANEIKKTYPAQFDFSFFKSNIVDKDENKYKDLEQEISSSSVIFIFIHSGISNFKNFERIKEKFNKKIPFFVSTPIIDEKKEFEKQPQLLTTSLEKMSIYYLLGGEENYKNLILYTASIMKYGDYPYKHPIYNRWEGICKDGYALDKKKESHYIEEIMNKKRVIAVLVHGKEWNLKRTKVLESFTAEIKKQGGTPYVVFTNSTKAPDINSKGIKWTIENYLKYKGQVIPDVIINMLPYSQTMFGNDDKELVDKSIFEELQIPVIQAMNTYQTREIWENDIRGLDSGALSTGVFYPEFDGQLISVTCCTHELIEDEFGPRYIFAPIEERVNKIVRLALNWIKLKEKKNKDKKIAIILHNMPPRNDMIGRAFGLDTPNSVNEMMRIFSEMGIKTEYDFKNGNEIIEKIIQGVSNDKTWLTAEKIMEKGIDTIPEEKYKKWFETLEKEIQEKMTTQWGTPPGKFMVYNKKFPVPGILNGNIFIGLQPSRGMEDKAQEVYHSTDIIIPHQYFAFYKWIKEVFKADVIYHVGTHGTLEWLPGKEVGLSSCCCPDFNIDDIPHLYPYSVNISGEGLQAKRRSNAILISHMIPPLAKAGGYQDIDTIDSLIKEYYQAQIGRDHKTENIENEILKKVMEYNYHEDMNITEIEIKKDFPLFLTKLHGYIEELKNSVIKDGLHILGIAPQGNSLASLIYNLLRVENCGIKPANIYIAEALGFNMETLKNSPYSVTNGKTNLMIIDEISDLTIKYINSIVQGNFYDILNSSYLGEHKIINHEPLQTLKTSITEKVIPKIKGCIRERNSIHDGANGKFIPPGQSGYPTRGNIDILPTGTNFYSIDPYKIPSQSAWEIGKKLGDALIQRYIQDEGKLPESIAMILYSGDTIKTNGDDVAEALYLMGVKPEWDENGKIKGVEAIPYEKLQRPRIDVTLRISGLFRDTFPVLIELLEDAVGVVADLDESEEINYIRKNILEDIGTLLSQGETIDSATDMAKVRIFGCPPGTYGTGVKVLIESKEWETRDDLGKVYINWSSHGYSSKFHGEKLTSMFTQRLKKTDITVKNEASVELDMLESDDYYAYHGGLTSAVNYAKGKNARSYSGNTSDLDNVKIKSLDEETARIMRARILNPKWIEGLKKHGYKGALEVSAMLDVVFGWDATAEVAKDWMYDRITEHYLENDENRNWIHENNPHALLNMAERLLEANQRKMWKGSPEKLEFLKNIYMGIEGDIEEIEE